MFNLFVFCCYLFFGQVVVCLTFFPFSILFVYFFVFCSLLFLNPLKKRGILFYLCLSIHSSARPSHEYFCRILSGTTWQGFLKFGFRVYISQLYRVIRFQIPYSTTSWLPNTKSCIILHIKAKFKVFVTFFSGTAWQGFLEFCFRFYTSQLYCVMRFQIHHSTTSCLQNTCIIVHIIAKLKIFVTYFSGTTWQGFLKFDFRVYINKLFSVMRFRIYHSTNSCLSNTCIILYDSQVENFRHKFSQ